MDSAFEAPYGKSGSLFPFLSLIYYFLGGKENNTRATAGSKQIQGLFNNFGVVEWLTIGEPAMSLLFSLGMIRRAMPTSLMGVYSLQVVSWAYWAGILEVGRFVGFSLWVSHDSKIGSYFSEYVAYLV